MLEKLAADKIQEIEELSKEGLKVAEIARRLGVSNGTVSKYRSRSDNELNRSMRGKVVSCLVCGFTLYPIFLEGKNYILWACPWCGFRGRTEEPEWRTIQDFEISKQKEK